ncbi:50S ribosome-binding GTPase [Streptomyces sp. DvalAA-14]|uniref:GTPase n=1 Tax=unclassified Streptomyces TaxID=2593676 RepID=UPI00081B969E|nr:MULTISPECIES: GTPase [unclassified Streptomyces]MYS24849.1 ATP-binding protein [Streptomyces sp. SID4948]SCE49912.1 50S ribosome-binding GTPase [Streptomyces sp. DvalAA-14]
MTATRSPLAAPAEPRATGGRDPLTLRAEALGELLGLSRTRVSPDALAEPGELLARIGERRRLSLDHTVVALAGATGSGKSSLFNMLAGRNLSTVGVRRPTTARPISCTWQTAHAVGLLDRLGIATHDRYTGRGRLDGPVFAGGAGFARSSVGDAAQAGERGRGAEEQSLDGLVLIDLPDHDSAAPDHREQVERLLRLVDVVVWVVDPEKYADAVLHESYLRPLAGHADVTLLVLNQVDRLPEDTAHLVLDDLRRLLDEDGLAVGEHGEAGAVVLATSALTGQGVPDLRAALAQIVTERAAAGLRLAADMDRTASRLHPLYVGEGGVGLTDAAREEFIDRLADAVGATAAGQLAERDWSDAAAEACRTPWSRLITERIGLAGSSRFGRKPAVSFDRGNRLIGRQAGAAVNSPGGPGRAGPSSSRPMIDEAVRGLAADAARGLPVPWAEAVADAARRGGRRLPAELDLATEHSRPGPPLRPRWWSVASAAQSLLMILAVAGVVGAAGVASGSIELAWWPALVMAAVGGIGGPLVSWICRFAARGPARHYGQAAERSLRDAAADCGRAQVLEPVAAELVRYHEVREQYAVVAGTPPRFALHAADRR